MIFFSRLKRLKDKQPSLLGQSCKCFAGSYLEDSLNLNPAQICKFLIKFRKKLKVKKNHEKKLEIFFSRLKRLNYVDDVNFRKFNFRKIVFFNEERKKNLIGFQTSSFQKSGLNFVDQFKNEKFF
jgi:hypothetical protein